MPPEFQKLTHSLPWESDQMRRGPEPLRGGSTMATAPVAVSILPI